jgi:hypothetical protein
VFIFSIYPFFGCTTSVVDFSGNAHGPNNCALASNELGQLDRTGKQTVKRITPFIPENRARVFLEKSTF